MKKISTLVCAALCALFTTQISAQYSENFDGGMSSLTGNCWTFYEMNWTNTPGEVINGTGSLYSNPPTSGGSTRDMITPALNCTSTALTISFNYKLSSVINGNATRTIEVGILDVNNNFTSLHMITMDKNTTAGVLTCNQNFTIPTGQKKVILKLGGSNGDGNSRIIVDDLYVSAGPVYGPGTTCNSAPIAVDDVFTGIIGAVVYGNIMSNDNEPNGETMTPSIVINTPDGIVVLNSDGSFTFTPNIGFLGTVTTFTYRLSDNGFPSMLSNIATVTINLVNPTPLAVKLLNFQGSLDNNKVSLQWIIGDNETASQFEVERSFNGKDFNMAALIFGTEKNGNEQYQYAENMTASKVFYRLRMMDNAGEITYSKILIFQSKSASDNGIRIISNPVNDKLTFSFKAEKNEILDIKIFDMAGRMIVQDKLNAYKGSNMASLTLDSFLKGGMYIVDLTNGTSHSTAKFVKQ